MEAKLKNFLKNIVSLHPNFAPLLLMKNLPPKKTFSGIIGVIFILLLLHIISYLNLLQNDLDPESFFFRKFNFDSERNVPAIFSGILHFTASFFLALIAFSRLTIKNRRWFWGAISFVFLFLGLDEILVIHEKVAGNIGALEDRGTFFYNWIIVYIGGLLALLFIFLKPLLSLPRKTLFKFLFAGFVFVFGATILEGIAGNIVFQRELAPEDVKTEPIIFILATFEELFEMLGVSLFIYALLDFMKKYRITTLSKEKTNEKIE